MMHPLRLNASFPHLHPCFFFFRHDFLSPIFQQSPCFASSLSTSSWDAQTFPFGCGMKQSSNVLLGSFLSLHQNRLMSLHLKSSSRVGRLRHFSFFPWYLQ